MDARTVDEATRQMVSQSKRVGIICQHCGTENQVWDICDQFYCIKCRKLNLIATGGMRSDPRVTYPI